MLYRLIDGPFFLGLCDEVRSLGDLPPGDQLNLWRVTAGAYRTIFYDALPVRKPSQTNEAFDAIVAAKVTFLNKLRAFKNVQVRDGITRLRTPARERGAAYRLEQKGVDTWIAVDAVKYALAGIADDIEIITSDADLYPALEVIRETRSRGVLRYSIGRTSDELIFSADEARPITILEVMGWMGLEEKHQAVGSHLDFTSTLETDIDGARFSFGRNQNEFLVNRTDALGGRMSLRTRSYLVVLNWLNDFGGQTPWRELDDRIANIKRA